MDDANKKEQTGLIPSEKTVLVKRSSGLVRRGLTALKRKEDLTPAEILRIQISRIVGSRTTLPEELPKETQRQLAAQALLEAMSEHPAAQAAKQRVTNKVRNLNRQRQASQIAQSRPEMPEQSQGELSVPFADVEPVDRIANKRDALFE